MKEIVQNTYKEPSKSCDNEPLVVHVRSRPSKNSTLVLFIHGLGGKRYGPKSTWMNFPLFVFDDHSNCDVGMYQYRTALGRLRFWESLELKDEADVLAGIIRDVERYDRVIFVAHSMGGLLSKAAVTNLIHTNQITSLDKQLYMVLMATPQTGSQRVPIFLSWFNKDARALSPHNRFVNEITDTFLSSVVTSEATPTAGKISVPTWAILGSSDFWVDKLSAGLGLAPERRKVVRGSHVGVVKPRNKHADAYQFVSAIIRRVSQLDADATRV